jgi:predicted metalloendopeptidase
MPGCPTKPSVPPLSRTRRPGDGFYTYVNQNWLNKAKIESWRSEYGVSDEMEEQTDKQLMDLIHSLKHTKPSSMVPKTSKEHLALMAYIWHNHETNSEETYLKICINQLISSISTREYARFFGWLCKSRISTIIELVAEEENDSPYYVRASFTPGMLTLPSSYYLSKQDKDKEDPTYSAYVQYIGTCAVELGLPFLLDAIEAEKEVATILDTPFHDLTKRVRGGNLHKLFPEFEIEGFMEGLDLDEGWRRRLWLLDAPERLQKIIHWLCTASTEKVFALFSLHLINFAAPYLRPAIKHAATNLFSRALQGVNHDPPKEKQILSDLKTILPDALCNLYADLQHDQTKLDDIGDLVDKLRGAAVCVMNETHVLSKKSRSATKEKIHRMHFEIGKGNPAPLPNVTYDLNSLLHSFILVLQGRSKQITYLTGHPSERKKSSYACFVSNASYFSESNNIVMPWGILQWPFYCKNAPLGWNYGGIGATISHEMTHAFDLEGIEYDPRAIYREWWTRKDKNRFGQKTRKVSKFFSQFKHYGIPLDGKKTLSENWADLGGIFISLRGLKTLLDSMNASDEVRKEAHRQFFIAYATSWRTLVRKEKMLYAITTSVHAPALDRVDRIVPQFQEWYDAFDIQDTDPLYVKPKDRLKFF